jgi:HEAT repeat protein
MSWVTDEDVIVWEDQRNMHMLMQAAAATTIDKSPRLSAIQALGRLGDSQAVTALVVALRDTDGNVQYWASEALAKIGGPAVDSLNACTKDPNKYVRMASGAALAKIGGPTASIAVIALTEDVDREVRVFAERLFKQMQS